MKKSFFLISFFLTFSYITSAKTFAVDDFELMRHNLREYVMLGNLSFDTTDTQIKNHVAKIASNAATYHKNLVKAPITYLWSDYNKLIGDYTYTCKHLYYSLQRLHTMALAWAYPTSPLYKDEALLNDIKNSLDFLYTYALNENTPLLGNFWEWRIGMPSEYAAIVSILYDELSKEQIDHYNKSFFKFVYQFAISGNLTYANQASICRNLLYMGVLCGDSIYISKALQYTKRAFCDETTLEQRKNAQNQFEDMILKQADYHDYNGIMKKEGLYEDGTFIQHVAIPYIGSYGKEIIQMSSECYLIFKGTSNALGQDIINVLPTWIEKAYIPAIYKGEMMRMFMGRSMSSSHDPHAAARSIGLSMYESMQYLKQYPSYQRIVDVCKQMYTQNSFYTTVYDGMDPIIEKPRINAMLAEGNESAQDKFNIVLAAGDRVIHQAEKFRLGIAMSSCRIGKYEGFSGNNLKGWYTGDGMTYIYTDNNRSHWKQYFTYCDYQRLPGTTVDTEKRGEEASNIALFGNPVNAQSWVGGTSLRGLYGTAGMSHVGAISDLVAKKSWFMFDKEVVCIGAGISMSESRAVETIVESYYSYDNFYIGEEKMTRKADEKAYANTSYAHLEMAGGYYFPTKPTINAKITGNGYAQLLFNHGQAPKDASYEYVLLPTFTKAQTEAYAANPEIIVNCNTKQVQAVTKPSLNITGINFWEATSACGVMSDGEASVMFQVAKDTLYLCVADPTWKRKSMTLTLDGEFDFISAHPSLATLSNGKTLTINCSDRMGQSVVITLLIKKPMAIDEIADGDIVSTSIYDLLGRDVTVMPNRPAGTYIYHHITFTGEIFTEKKFTR